MRGILKPAQGRTGSRAAFLPACGDGGVHGMTTMLARQLLIGGALALGLLGTAHAVEDSLQDSGSHGANDASRDGASPVDLMNLGHASGARGDDRSPPPASAGEPATATPYAPATHRSGRGWPSLLPGSIQ